ncbi:MAG: pyridoxal phosphate-dependent aminotransferase [Lentisphaeria bacterium]|nr:pyridoxal phosphate-dependent aminotransferase [Lentisphaeria bacterium]MBR4076131.1 pyridoxal phosphate-dependent aminotransferase [Lentisphaeria bacterium]
MELLTPAIKAHLGNSSWIRRMFEAGIELKKKYGAENVFDYSLGNPDIPAPEVVKTAMTDLAEHALDPFAFGYMPNAGLPEVRAALAAKLGREQGVDVGGEKVLVTCGAAGGINVFFRAVLSAGDEVLCPAPYFVEYGFYAENYGGLLKSVPCKEDFTLDIAAMDAAITPRTRAVIINSPNNPTGQIYSAEEINALAEVLRKHSVANGRVIYLISDEPYRFLNFDGVEIPSMFKAYDATVVIGSFSKNLSLAGERIGFIGVNPALENGQELMAGLIMCNRILGFVNAPVVAQKLILQCMDSEVDLNIYRRRRDKMAKVLKDAGLEFTMPRGAFYFFPKSPTADESVFINALVEQRVLAVPGRGFGMPGYFRLAFCSISEEAIEKSADSFKRAVESVRGGN